MCDPDAMADAISQMTNEELGALVDKLDPLVQHRLGQLLQQPGKAAPAVISEAPAPAAPAAPAPAAGKAGGGGAKGGYGGGYGGAASGGKGAGGKGGGGKGASGKQRERAPLGPVPPPLDRPEALPACARSGEQVAFQCGVGQPWKLLGPIGGSFRWDLQDRNAVAFNAKQEVREILQAYADEHSISVSLEKDSPTKLALQRGNFWISFAGGISSAAGRPDAPMPTRGPPRSSGGMQPAAAGHESSPARE